VGGAAVGSALGGELLGIATIAVLVFSG